MRGGAACGGRGGRGAGRGQGERGGGQGGGGGGGAAAAALLAAVAPADAEPTVYEYQHQMRVAEGEDRFGHAGLPPAAGLLRCSVGWGHAAFVAAQGTVLCAGENEEGQLGVGDDLPRVGFTAPRLPWPAAAVRCGGAFCVALRRGGAAVCSWGDRDRIGRGGDSARPAEVPGLPAGDPVVLLEAGYHSVIAVTASGAAYGWGMGVSSRIVAVGVSAYEEAPVRIAELSGRRLRRLACGCTSSLAETEEGELLLWGGLAPHLRAVPADGVAFPLRCMACCSVATPFALADAAGRVWTVEEWDHHVGMPYRPVKVERAALPEGRRAVRVATARDEIIVVLTVCGELWDCGDLRNCRRIGAQLPAPPRGLLPCGGADSDRVLLLPDPSCGRARLRLFARVAVRLGLPTDPLRAALVPYAVDGCYVTGPENDPFSWPSDPAAAAAG
eukprot:TRINITY_DN681_c0_g2_i1.p2 TRINITY_DN681_c0_g2~~TRINITY_DN681_c0_g2_i1.p2  ORF type:complete len:443 (+),score=106.07 TRINITY_DN681_c0_g2_i1:79-1407(+)